MRRPALLAVVVVALMAVVPTCAPHPVGPARTYDDYERKARSTVEAVRSAVETVALAAKAGGDDHATGPYLSVLISDQEESITAASGTFASIQPPGERADELRATVVDLVDGALDDVVDARIAARRGDRDALAAKRTPLENDGSALDRFAKEHGA